MRAGTLGAACVRIAVEDHGANGHVALYRVWPRLRGSVGLVTVLVSVGAALALHGNLVAGCVGGALATILLVEALQQSGKGIGAVLDGIDEPERERAPAPAPIVVIRPQVATLAAPDRRPVEGVVAP